MFTFYPVDFFVCSTDIKTLPRTRILKLRRKCEIFLNKFLVRSNTKIIFPGRTYIMDTKIRKIPWNTENGNVIPNLLNLVAEAKKKLFSVDVEATSSNAEATPAVPPVEKKRRWMSSLYMGIVIMTCLLGAFICLRNFITWWVCGVV